MNTKHTPGPWVLDEYGNVYASKGRGRRKLLIAQTNRAHLEAEQPYANGRLVAAAPELLAALRDLVEYVSPGDDVPLAAMLEEARAIIAKVRP